MKLSIASIFILVSLVWNIAFTDYASAITVNESDSELVEVSTLHNYYSRYQLSFSAKDLCLNLISEEITENEEKIDKDFIPFLIIKVLLLNTDELLEEQQLFVVNNDLPSVGRLFVKFCSLKIPLHS